MHSFYRQIECGLHVSLLSSHYMMPIPPMGIKGKKHDKKHLCWGASITVKRLELRNRCCGVSRSDLIQNKIAPDSSAHQEGRGFFVVYGLSEPVISSGRSPSSRSTGFSSTFFFSLTAKTLSGSRQRKLQKGSTAEATTDPTMAPIHLTNSSQHPPFPLPNPNREQSYAQLAPLRSGGP
jgi:hypothetical protein